MVARLMSADDITGQIISATVRATIAANLADKTQVEGAALWAEFGFFVQPSSFGAVGDGVTDDTSALQAMIAAAGTKPMLITKPHKVSTSLNTVQAGQTFLGVGGSLTSTWVSGPNSALIQSGFANTTVRGLQFSAGPYTCIRFTTGADNSVIENCIAIGANSFAAVIMVNRCRVSKNIATGMGGGASQGSGVQIWGGDANPSNLGYPGDGVYGVDGCLVEGNYFTATPLPGSGTGFVASSPVWSSCARGVRVIGNYASGFVDVGIDFEGSTQCVAVGNVLRDCGNSCMSVFFASTDCLFEDNICIQSAAMTNTNYKGFGFWATAEATSQKKNIIVRGNYFEMNGAVTTAIMVDSGATAFATAHSDCVAESNTIVGGSIVFYGTQDCRISRNSISNGTISSRSANRTLILGNDIITGPLGNGTGIIILDQPNTSKPGLNSVVMNNVVRRGTGGNASLGIFIANISTPAVGHIVKGNLIPAINISTADASITQAENSLIA